MGKAVTRPAHLPPDGSIDAGLLVLELITPHGQTWTQEEIAEVCGCSKGYIWWVQKGALAKMRRRMEQLRREGYV